MSVIDEPFSLVPSSGGGESSFDDFTFIRTVTNTMLRSLEESVQNKQQRQHHKNRHHNSSSISKSSIDVDHISLLSMKSGESVSLMYWMNIADYLADWEAHVNNVEKHLLADAHRLQCRIHNQPDKASANDILHYAKEWPDDSFDRNLIYAAGTATCIGTITQLVSYALLDEDINLCEQVLKNHPQPLVTRIHEYVDSASQKRSIHFNASKVLSCCKVDTGTGLILEYGTCSMHVFRDRENPGQMILLADILRVPAVPARVSHTFSSLQGSNAYSLSEILCLGT